MLICDKRRPARARGYQYQAPPRGPNKDSPPGLRPAPRAPPPRGAARPRPLGCAPWRAFAHRAPAASVIQPEGFRARVRRWRGGQPLAVVHARRPAPGGFRASGKFQRWAVRMHGGVRGRAPCCRATVATRPRRWAARVQPQAVPAVHGLGEVVHGRPGHSTQRLRHPVPARRRRSALPTENKRTIFLKMEKS